MGVRSKAKGAKGSKSCRTVAEAVPSKVLIRLDAALLELDALDDESVVRIHSRLDLGNQYGVSVTQVGRYAAKLRARAEAVESSSDTKDAFPDASSKKTVSFRAQMHDDGEIVSAMARALEAYDPVEWGRGAYFALLGAVFAMFRGQYVGLEVPELVALSKVIAEQRTAEVRSASGARPKGKKRSGEGLDVIRELPENFGDLVRQIYGAGPAGGDSAKKPAAA